MRSLKSKTAIVSGVCLIALAYFLDYFENQMICDDLTGTERHLTCAVTSFFIEITVFAPLIFGGVFLVLVGIAVEVFVRLKSN